MTILKSKDIIIDELISILESLPDDMRIVRENPESMLFDWFSSDVSIENSYRGRIFSEAGEVKWRKIGNKYRTVFLGNQDLVGTYLDDYSCKLEGLLEPPPCKYVLWGERTKLKNEWVEQVVPHRFKYPFNDGNFSDGRLVLVIKELRDSSMQTIFNRFEKLEEIGG